MADVNIKINVVANAAKASVDDLTRAVQTLDKTVDRFGSTSKKGFGKTTEAAKKTGRAMEVFKGFVGANLFLQLGSQIKRGIGESVRLFAEFETGLVGVSKTTDIAGKELEDFGDQIKELSERIPISVQELLKVSQIAGQLGIRGSKNLLKFTETIGRLTVATDLTAESASFALSRLLALSKEPVSNVDVLGSVLVDLGNKVEATESQIITVASEVSRATSAFQVSSTQVVSYAAAMARLGVQAESGGTAIGRVFQKIELAIATGKNLEDFNEIMGLTGDQLKKTFEEDSGKAFELFIKGLANIRNTGGSAILTLKDLGLSNQRLNKAILPLVKNYDRFTEAIKIGNDEQEKNTALLTESEKAFATLASESIKLGNTLKTFVIDALADITPPIKEAIKFWRQFLGELNNTTPNERISDLRGELKAMDVLMRPLIIKSDELKEKWLEQREAGKTNSVVQREASKTLNEYGRAQARVLPLLEQRKKLEDELKSLLFPEGAPEESSEVQKEIDKNKTIGAVLQERKNIFDLFNAGTIAAADQVAAQEKLRFEIQNEEGFKQLEDTLGAKAALQLAFQNQQILNSAKTEEQRIKAEKRVQDNITKAMKKSFDDREELEKKRRLQTLSNTATMFGALAGLARTGGEKLFKVARAFSLAEALLAGYVAIQKAASALPFPANVPGIVTETARAATSVAQITATTPKFQDGGIVPGNSTSGDNVTARVNSGEMILNRAQQAQLFSVANGQQGGASEQIIEVPVNIDGEEIFKVVSRQVANGGVLGEGGV